MPTDEPNTPAETNLASPPLPKMQGENPHSPMSEQVSFVFWFMIVFAGFLLASRPANNTAQLIFRIGLLAVGVVGLIALKLMRKR